MRKVRPFVSVAERELSVSGSRAKVKVEIGRPSPRDVDYACEYKISYGRKNFSNAMYGVDAFQALQLALKTLPVELRYLKGLPLGRMYWLEPGDDMGFSEKDGWQ